MASPTSLNLNLDVFPFPFTSESQLYTNDQPINHLPGYPQLAIDNHSQLTRFLRREYISPDLDTLASHLWLLSTQSSAHIWPLHHQRVKGRAITITEDPKLHLVWIDDRIFIKPLPAYLVSHSFWADFLLSHDSPLGTERESIYRAALGYLRTYYYLIQYESDFEIACRGQNRLIPQGITWPQFCAFTASFLDVITDDDVSQRYHYGELRLTRLNLYAKVFLQKWDYEQLHGQYAAYFARFYGPLLFVFGILSVILNAMQVELAVEAVDARNWISLWHFCRWFSMLCLAFPVVQASLLIFILTGMMLDELIYALRDLYMKRKATRVQSSKA
ncbi:hypothetical protein MMC12_002447 [Toensbergia leucococca]|nr:hypothetical protein [Toensbergia leucococca]